MKLLISACLLGEKCRYDGKGFDPTPLAPLVGHTFVAVCPEILGGLETPRCPAERKEGRVCSLDGQDVTSTFQTGAERTLSIAQAQGCHCALFKERSPSCGSSLIYDGSFTGKKIAGEGVTTALLRQNSIEVFSEEQLEALLQWIAAQRV